ncbi:MAG: hypothetical protein JWL83_2440, partial [Actinomycetia bacterium]|nr:hypothetical protein [Actinomycetes bacterium]
MRKFVALFVVVATATLGLVSVASAQGKRHPIPGSHPAWATPAARVGASDAKQAVTFRVYLSLRDAAGAAATADAVANPKSPSFHHYLTTAEVRARFAPTATAVGSVKSWLRAAGFTINGVPSNNQYVEATGSIAHIAAAFGVNLGQYHVKGKV